MIWIEKRFLCVLQFLNLQTSVIFFFLNKYSKNAIENESFGNSPKTDTNQELPCYVFRSLNYALLTESITRKDLQSGCASSQTRNNKRGQQSEINVNSISGLRKKQIRLSTQAIETITQNCVCKELVLAAMVKDICHHTF